MLHQKSTRVSGHPLCSVNHGTATHTMTLNRSRHRSLRWLLPLTMLAVVSGVAGQRPEPRTIEVLAKRFTFEPAVVEARVGEPLRLVVRSGDGVHGIEIKKFKVKKEIPRGGEPVVIEFTPDAAGRFPIICSEYCGDDHDAMKGSLVVQARDAGSR